MNSDKAVVAEVNLLSDAVTTVADALQSLRDDSVASSPRRAEIVALSAILFAERGYRGTTIRDIADRCEIVSGTLYHHFKSKEAIIDEIVRAYWCDLFAEYERVLETERAGTAQIREMIGGSFRMLAVHGPAIRILINDYPFIAEALPHLKSIMVVTERVWVDMLVAGERHGDLRPGLDPVLTYRTIVGAISETARWFDATGTISMEQVIKQMQLTFTHGISTQQG